MLLALWANNPDLLDATAEAIRKIRTAGYTVTFDLLKRKYQLYATRDMAALTDDTLVAEFPVDGWQQLIQYADDHFYHVPSKN